jgi:hypothetical protein
MKANRIFLWVLAALSAITFLITHVVWPYALPTPWIDEAQFLIPAASFLTKHNFTANQMLVHQIYWLPTHMYIVYGSFFKLFGSSSLQLARNLSFLLITTAALALRSTLASLMSLDDRSRALGNGLVFAWYLSLPIVFCADLLRPDALSLLLSISALSLFLNQRYMGAFSISVLSIFTHPLEALPAITIGLCALPFLQSRSTRLWEWALAAWALGLLLLESIRFVDDVATYRYQMSYQVSRKASHHIPALAWFVALLILISIALFLKHCDLTSRKNGELDLDQKRRLATGYLLSCIFVPLFGQEMWYWIWAITGLVLLAAISIDWVQTKTKASNSLTQRTERIVAVVFLLLGLSTWLPGFRAKGIYGFLIKPRPLSKLVVDETFIRESIDSILISSGSSQVLASPQVFAQLAAQRKDEHFVLWTWSPFSETKDFTFDHLVILTKSYPGNTGDDMLPPTIAMINCFDPVRLRSPNGYYEVAIAATSALPIEGKTTPCASLQRGQPKTSSSK